VTVEATSPAGATVTLTARVQDPDCNTLSVTWNTDGGLPERMEEVGHADQSTPVTFTHVYPVGVHPVTITVSDGTADPVVGTTTVTVRDTTAPPVSCSLVTGMLWPPNHQFVDVGLTIHGADSVGKTTYTVTVYGNEDDEETADGHHSPDAVSFPAGGPGPVRSSSGASARGAGTGAST
jgi:hypothetical protein